MVISSERQWSGRLVDGIGGLVMRLDPGSVAAFVLPFLLYALTLAPSIYNLDSAELTTAVVSRGIVRATGYPLYLVLGRVWMWLPMGDLGYRLNLFSAFSGAMTIFLAERILRRLEVRSWARLGALGLLATAPYFWGLSLIAEVYTLHTMLMAAIVLTLLRWAEEPSARRLALPVFLTVLSMGNHAATVLLVPGCLWYVLTTQPRVLLQWRTWTYAAVAAVLGAGVFLYLPLAYAAGPAFNYAGAYDAQGVFHPVNLASLSGLIWLITGRTFESQMFGYRLEEVWPQFVNFGLQLWTAFMALGIGPGVLGLVVLTRRNWRLGGMLLLLFAANAIFYINYRVVDKNTMFLPTYFIWALWLGIGYQTLLSWVHALRTEASQTDDRLPARLAAAATLRVVHLFLVGAVIIALAWNWSRVDLSHDWSTREQSEAILRQVEPDAIVFGWWETVPGLQFLQLAEGRRPDVLAINRFLISGDDMQALIANSVGERPIYINSPSLELIQTMEIVQVGPLYQVLPRERPAREPIFESESRFK